MSQNYVSQILHHLKQGKAITKLEALTMFGCWNSGDVIFKLRNKGHNIITTMMKTNGKRYASYKLKEQK